MENKILVVDDEADICEILNVNLHTAGYEVDTAGSAEEAMELCLTDYKLVILDIMMGEMSGLELLHYLRRTPETSQMAVLLLTAKDCEEAILLGFKEGADDYITKPFSPREVVARVGAVLNRAGRGNQHEPAGEAESGIQIRQDEKNVYVNGLRVSLTRTEYELLCLMMDNEGHVFSRSELIGQVWPQGVIVTDRTVDVNITRLRKKLHPYNECLRSRPGYGYFFTRNHAKEKAD